jgi:hypothetical protein
MKFYEQFNKYMEEASIEKLAQQDPREIYSDEEVKNIDNDPELMPETGPQEAFKTLENALDKFYDLGKKGLSPDPQAVNDRVYNILVQHEVDEKNLKTFSDVLMSIILGQSMRGYADSQD